MKMTRVSGLLLLLCSTVVCVRTTAQWSYPTSCAPKNTVILDPTVPVNTKLPPLPVLPDLFQLRIEGNLIDKKKTVSMDEFYDASNGRAAVHLFQNNSMSIIIFDYKNNQSLNVHPNGTCYVIPLNLDADTKILGLQQKSGTGPFHSYTTKGSFQFAKANGLLYKGTKVVRGIDCDWWQSCMYWSEMKDNFTLDYYFSAYNWTSADTSKQIPVLAEVKGLSLSVSPGVPFHHRYEFFEFRHALLRFEDETVFETPSGVVCPGRVQTRQLPPIPEQFSCTEEIVDTQQLIVSRADIYYDHISRLVRFDYMALNSAPYNDMVFATEIHDYNTGVAYAIDTVRGNCTIFPISNNTFDNSGNISNEDGNRNFYLHMKSSRQLFFLNSTTYTYEGTRTVRSILCDVFISKTKALKIPSFGDFETTVEVYFMNQEFSTYMSRNSTTVLVQIRMTTPDWVGYTAIYNIYNFVAGAPGLDKFPISPCFDDSSKKSFKIEFPGSWDSSLMQYRNLLIQQNTVTLASRIHVSPIRVQNRQISVYPDKFYFIATLLEQPPDLAFFHKLPGRVSLSWYNKTSPVPSAEYCANLCNDPEKQCDIFYYCPDVNSCKLGQARTTDPSKKAMSKLHFVEYVRSIQTSSRGLPLSVAWKDLKNSVLAGLFQLNINISGQLTTLTADSIDDSVIQNPKRSLSTKTLMNMFNGQTNKAISGYSDLIITGISTDDCASECLDQKMWICNSFQYCFDIGYCILSKLHPDEHPSFVVNSDQCDLYSKKYTVDYQKVPGLTVLSSSDIIYQNIYTADQCAKLCSLYDEFSCKSFDYCDDISTCYLGRTHYYDIPKADMNDSPMCSHYSRKYLSDFKVNSRRKMSTSDVRIISSISVDECAKLCVEEEAADCSYFGYCGNTTECMFSTTSMKNIGQVISEANLWCNIYIRQTFPDGTPYTTKSTSCISAPPSTASTPGTRPSPSTTKITPVNYIVDYQNFTGITAVSNSDDTFYHTISSADECAKLCSCDESDCESFGLCEGLPVCYLSRMHYFDIPKSEIKSSAGCTYYTRNYLTDFNIGIKEKLPISRMISSVSIAQCAKLCVKEETFNCSSFGYCENTTECVLSTASVQNTGHITSYADLCGIYIRKTFSKGISHTTKPSSCANLPISTASTIPGRTTPSSYKPRSSSSSISSARHMTGQKISSSGQSSGKSYSSSFSSTRRSTVSEKTVPSQNLSTNKPLKYANSAPSSDKGLSGGAIAGLAIGMMFAGILIAVLVYFGHNKLRRRSPLDMTVPGVKHEMELRDEMTGND